MVSGTVSGIMLYCSMIKPAERSWFAITGYKHSFLRSDQRNIHKTSLRCHCLLPAVRIGCLDRRLQRHLLLELVLHALDRNDQYALIRSPQTDSSRLQLSGHHVHNSLMPDMKLHIRWDHLPPLAFQIESAPVKVRGIINDQLCFGRIHNINPLLKIADEISRLILYERRNANALKRI